MEIIDILISILDKPDIPKPYRELQRAYLAKGKIALASAIGALIDKKFEKPHESNDPYTDSKQ